MDPLKEKVLALQRAEAEKPLILEEIVAKAQKIIAESIKLPKNYRLEYDANCVEHDETRRVTISVYKRTYKGTSSTKTISDEEYKSLNKAIADTSKEAFEKYGFRLGFGNVTII